MNQPFLPLSEQVLPNDLLAAVRKKAFENFLKEGYPTRKNENFQYVSLAKLYTHNFEKAKFLDLDPKDVQSKVLPQCKNSYITFVNGHFVRDLSKIPEGVVVDTLEEAMQDYAIFLQSRLQNSIKVEKNPFALLNTSFHEMGIFIYIPPQTTLSSPLQILHLTKAKESGPYVSFPRSQIFLGKNSHLKVCITTHSLTEFEHNWMAPYVEAILEENSFLEVSDVIQVPCNNWIFADYRYILKKAAKLSSVDFSQGSKTVRRDYRVTLQESNAHAELFGLAFLKEEREEHIHVLIEHKAEECTSNQFFRKVLNGKAKASFEGKILVDPMAQKTAAYQLNNNLLLSEDAKAFAKPNLEIYADDVKASHGATFGQLSSEELFYMRSRGINEKKAKQMLVEAFCHDILCKLPPNIIGDKSTLFSC